MSVRKRRWTNAKGQVRETWMIHVEHRLPTGKRKVVRKVALRQSRRGAEQEEREIRQALLDHTYGKENQERVHITPKLKDFAVVFINTYCTTNNRPSTVREKRRAMGRGLLEELGELRLNEIGVRDVERFKARRRDDGVGNKSINEELAILSKLLDYAHEIGELLTTPVRIRRLKTQKPGFDFFNFEEAAQLVAAAEDAPRPWGTMIQVAMLTGMRLGELRGLRWKDVDLRAKQIHVRVAADDKGVLGPPKSGQARVIDLPGRAVTLLREHRRRGETFVFCRDDGSMLQNWHCEAQSTRRGMTSPLMRVCDAAGLRRLGWHGLRHTYASHLIMRGASVMQVKELLGHSTVVITMRYAHLSPSARKVAVALLDAGEQHIHST